MGKFQPTLLWHLPVFPRMRSSVSIFLLHPSLWETTSCFSLKCTYVNPREKSCCPKLKKVTRRGIYEDVSKGFSSCWISFETSYTVTGCKLLESRDQEYHRNLDIPRTYHSVWPRAGSHKAVLNKWMNKGVTILYHISYPPDINITKFWNILNTTF